MRFLIFTEVRGADFFELIKTVMEKILAGYSFELTDFVFFEPSPQHKRQRIDANTDATNNTTKTTYTNTHCHTLTQTLTTKHHQHTTKHTHSFPAQLYQDSCFLHDANMLGQQGMGHSPRTMTLKQVRAVFTERESRLDE